MTGIRKHSLVAVLALSALASACTDSTTSSGTTTTVAGSSTTVAGATTTVAGATTTSVAPTSSAAPTTLAPTTVPATPAPTPAPTAPPPPPTTTAGGACDGASGIPGGADIGTVIHGDIDGDLANDTVTEYSLAGVPHVHAQLATGGQSDAAVQVGFGDHVSIKFTDFDHSLGAPTPPPVAVMAIGGAAAGTAYFTILTLTTQYCIRPWRLGGSMFVGHLSDQPPYEGLWCDGAAGHIYYSLVTVENAGGNNWTITSRLMHHNFTTLTLDAPQVENQTMSEADMRSTFTSLNPC